MRTTLNLDEDVVEVIKNYAAGRNLSLGSAASELVRKAATTPLRTKVVNGLTIFDPPADSPIVTNQQIEDLKAEFF